MGAEVTVRLNRRGVRELLRSREVLGDLERRAERIHRAEGGDGFTDSAIGPQRARAAVVAYPGDADGLLRALDAGR